MPIVESNGIKIYYETYGDGDPLVLISGLGSPLGSWETQIPIYSKKFKVIAFDNRGVGRSEITEQGFTIEDMADDTIGLIDSLGIGKASFLGKSMGGMITQRIGIKYPDRVNKLVIGCSSASRDEVGNVLLSGGREVATKAGMKAVWMTGLFYGYTREYIEKNIDLIKSSLEDISEDEEVLKGYLGQSMACEGHHSLDEVGLITSETLVMYGDRDLIMSPKKSVEMAEIIPNSRLESFSDVGHGFWREKQEEVDKIVMEFLC
ncbi:MAG: alpha/beta fold hydrolase [Thermodesulfobacteriota bacterium]